MDKEQLNELLVSALMSYQLCGNGFAIRKAAEKLASKSFFDQLKVGGENKYQKCLDLLSSYGTVIEAYPDKCTIVGLVGSGTLNMNPTALVINVTDDAIFAVATAKEGLINQKSAEKAVQHFLSFFAC